MRKKRQTENKKKMETDQYLGYKGVRQAGTNSSAFDIGISVNFE